MYKLPVRGTQAFELVDANNVVLVPSIIYKGDLAHRSKQRRVLDDIVAALNGLIHTPSKKDEAEIVQVVNGRRGNPAFQKGKSNPYAKKGGDNA